MAATMLGVSVVGLLPSAPDSRQKGHSLLKISPVPILQKRSAIIAVLRHAPTPTLLPMKPQPATPCPCGLNAHLADCCGRYHGGTPAPTAEALMRSRYSAYVLGLEDYLLATWHASTRPASLDLTGDTATRWLGLSVKRHEVIDETHAIVEFVARHKIGGRAYRLHEVSRFVREEGRWFYVDGEFPNGAVQG